VHTKYTEEISVSIFRAKVTNTPLTLMLEAASVTSTLMMEPTGSSEVLVRIYQTSQRHILADDTPTFTVPAYSS
jgi:hypothetical protein